MNYYQNDKLSIKYFGKPLALVVTKNEDYSEHFAIITSLFWLGRRCIVGLDKSAKTAKNLLRTESCLICLPSTDQMNVLLRTYLSPVTSAFDQSEDVSDEINLTDLNSLDSTKLKKGALCKSQHSPVQMEAEIDVIHDHSDSDTKNAVILLNLELKITRLYLNESILKTGSTHEIDSRKWNLLMNKNFKDH